MLNTFIDQQITSNLHDQNLFPEVTSETSDTSRLGITVRHPQVDELSIYLSGRMMLTSL